MPNVVSRLQKLAATARAHIEAEQARAAAERAGLEERAKGGDPAAVAALARLVEREERRRAQFEEWQRRFQTRMEQQAGHGRRRGRLTPDDVVAAALELLDANGLDGVTLRDVAGRLHVQAPALYWHFASKRDMVDAMAEAILADLVATIEPPETPESWRPWLRQTAHRLRQAMLARRDGGRIVAGAGLGRAHALAALIAMSLSVLETAGFDAVTASAGTRTVIGYTFGAVIEEQAGPDVEPDGPEAAALARDFPDIARAVDAQLQLSPTAQFDMGLELILRGLASRK